MGRSLRLVRNLRYRLAWAIMQAMAELGKKKINERDVSGLKYFKKKRPLFERLHEVGCKRDPAGNRTPHDDQY